MTADIIAFPDMLLAIVSIGRKQYGLAQIKITVHGNFIFSIQNLLFCRRSKSKPSFKSAKSKGKQAKYLDNKIGGKSAARHEKDNDSLQVSFKLDKHLEEYSLLIDP